MLILTDYAAQAIVNALVQSTGAGPFHNCYVGLYTNNTSLSSNIVQSSLVEATYTSYARVEVTSWGTTYLGADNSIQVNGPLIEFQPSDGVTPNTCYGYFLTTATGYTTTLLAVEAFSAPMDMSSALDAILVSPNLSANSPQNNNGAGLVTGT